MREGGRYIDGTFGAGGYTPRHPRRAAAAVLAIDRDPAAIAAGAALVEAECGGRLTLVEGRFSDLDAHRRGAPGFAPVDGVVLDVGVSSMQLDEAERGFSFRLDGPLDMRMGHERAGRRRRSSTAPRAQRPRPHHRASSARSGRRAASRAPSIAARDAAPILRTRRLAEIVASRAVGPPDASRIHPATRTFQALRIFVNRELDELAEALAAAERILRDGGRLVVVAFHSLEDRIVKRFLQERSGRVARLAPRAAGGRAGRRPSRCLSRGAVEPGEAEVAANPRARSARLRAAIRTAAPAARRSISAALGVPESSATSRARRPIA